MISSAMKVCVQRMRGKIWGIFINIFSLFWQIDSMRGGRLWVGFLLPSVVCPDSEIGKALLLLKEGNWSSGSSRLGFVPLLK